MQLKLFYDNTAQREAVQAFFVEQLREMAADMALNGEDVKGIKDAGALVTKVFDTLHSMYGKIETPKEQNSR